MANPGQKEDYGLTGRKQFIQKHVWDLGLCFDKREKDFWDIHVCQTCYRVPIYYLAGCCCSCCVACYHREHLLYGKMYEEYKCCQGAYGKFWCTPLARKIPHCCLLAESFCCTGCAIAGNRMIMKERYLIQETLCETILLIVGAILSFFGFFGATIAMITNGCLNSQEERQLIVKEGKTGLTLYATKWDPNQENNCWNLNQLSPCCGDPCNVKDGLKCAVCWICPCFFCTFAKFFASTLDETCTMLNHCLPVVLALLISMFCGWIPGASVIPWCYLNTAVRHNARVKSKKGDPVHYFGDCMMSNCCLTACCSLCQELRTMPIESWDWVAQLQKDGFPQKTESGDIRFFRDDGESNVGKNLPTEKGEDSLKGALSGVAAAVKGGSDDGSSSSESESDSEE